MIFKLFIFGLTHVTHSALILLQSLHVLLSQKYLCLVHIIYLYISRLLYSDLLFRIKWAWL
uniref:Uncharacterized protein n=1 Tax=Arundo donax TaxID=35708 RepID=A0A0A9E6V6_ARUDO